MSDGEELENQGFKVKDRRRFHADGSPVVETSLETEAAPKPEATESPSEAGPVPEREAREIPADFSSLLLSIAAGAHSGLGLAPHPLTGKTERNLSQAKYNIDLLGLLEEKTKGNLSDEEAKLLQALLYDLRMRYLEVKSS